MNITNLNYSFNSFQTETQKKKKENILLTGISEHTTFDSVIIRGMP
jgi:hypothetical protein